MQVYIVLYDDGKNAVDSVFFTIDEAIIRAKTKRRGYYVVEWNLTTQSNRVVWWPTA